MSFTSTWEVPTCHPGPYGLRNEAQTPHWPSRPSWSSLRPSLAPTEYPLNDAPMLITHQHPGAVLHSPALSLVRPLPPGPPPFLLLPLSPPLPSPPWGLSHPFLGLHTLLPVPPAADNNPCSEASGSSLPTPIRWHLVTLLHFESFSPLRLVKELEDLPSSARLRLERTDV